MNIFTKNDYREILDQVISERKKLDSNINFQQMAEQIRVPKSYLSRVVHGKADLNTDQLYLICRYLDFTEGESAYMELLLEFARTGIKSRREKLLQEIRQIQMRHLETKAHIKAKSVEFAEDELAAYYLDPLFQLAHICLSIPRYQKDQNLLAHDLKVSPARLLHVINRLEQMRLITRTKDVIQLTVENMHLPKQSPVYKAWRNHTKLQTMQRLDNVSEDQAYSFAVVFSASEESRREIHSRFLNFLKGVEQVVGSSRQEEAYQMNFDLFPWTTG